MKINIYILLLIALTKYATAQVPQFEDKKMLVRYDGIYECKEWLYVDKHTCPAYYRIFGDSVLLFCRYEDTENNDADSVANAKEIFQEVLSKENLDEIERNIAKDPTAISKSFNKFTIKAYSYKLLPDGICYDVLSEKPSCPGGKPNIKIINSDLLRTDDGDPIDDRIFKFVAVNK